MPITEIVYVSKKQSYLHSRNLILLLSAIALYFTGCNFLSLKDDNKEVPQLKTLASSNKNPVTVPVEIAQDISKIIEGKPIEEKKITPQQTTTRAAQTTADIAAVTGSAKRGPAQHRSGKTEKYTVRQGDTLMKIAFEKYGNVYRWREILNSNKTNIQDFNHVPPGTVLKIEGVEYLVIHRDGKPYFIIKNDSLVKISKKVYGTTKEWSAIWKNNPELIHNPNKIYAGFTLYYQPMNNSLELRKPSSK